MNDEPASYWGNEVSVNASNMVTYMALFCKWLKIRECGANLILSKCGKTKQTCSFYLLYAAKTNSSLTQILFPPRTLVEETNKFLKWEAEGWNEDAWTWRHGTRSIASKTNSFLMRFNLHHAGLHSTLCLRPALTNTQKPRSISPHLGLYRHVADLKLSSSMQVSNSAGLQVWSEGEEPRKHATNPLNPKRWRCMWIEHSGNRVSDCRYGEVGLNAAAMWARLACVKRKKRWRRGSDAEAQRTSLIQHFQLNEAQNQSNSKCNQWFISHRLEG